MPRITELYAWVVADTGPDDERIPAFIDPESGAWMAMVGADLELAFDLRPVAMEYARAIGKPFKLVRATNLETVEVINP